MKLQTLLFALTLATTSLAATYEQAKEALLTLDKLKTEKLITEEEYASRRQKIIETIGSAPVTPTTATAPDQTPSADSKFFTAKVRRVNLQRNGEIAVVLDVSKVPGDNDVVLRLNDDPINTLYPAYDEAEVLRRFESLPITLTSSDGGDYKLVNASGIGYFTEGNPAFAGEKEPPTLPDKGSTTVTFRFRRAGRDSVTSPESFTLDAQLCVFVRTDPRKHWSHNGRVSIHLDGLRPTAVKAK